MLVDILIIGAGPAGSAAAIELANLRSRHPSVAPRILVLDKAKFPRPKLCGGGVTGGADKQLVKLGVRIDVPAIPIHAMKMVLGDRAWTLRWRNLFRVVRREEFDHALMCAARARGVTIREGEAVVDLWRENGTALVRTSAGEYRARIVIGADGANSVVRQKLGLARGDRISRLMEILTPVDALTATEFREHTAVFDFTPLLRGVQGYYWDFPSLKDDERRMNRGLFDSRVRADRERAQLKPIFGERLNARGVDLTAYELQGHPERWFDAQTKHSAPGVLLAGDAAGTEPLLGEGISYALEFGRFAAHYAWDKLAREDFEFADYEQRIRASSLGRVLRFKRFLAHYIYGNRPEWLYRWGWNLAGLVLR